MSDESGRVWVAYNGEIYNFQDCAPNSRVMAIALLRSDTEVLVHGWEEWREGLLDRIEGMFAFCLHDVTRTHAARPRSPRHQAVVLRPA